MSRRDWIRVRSSWWTDPDHTGLSFGAKTFGPVLMWIADGDPTWRESGRGRLLGGSGAAAGLPEVARMAGARLREVRRWVAELIKVGTLRQDEDGLIYFPNYRRHQENPSAKRVRKHRYSNVTVTPDVTVEEEQKQRVEEEEESASPTKRRTTRPPSIDAHNAAQYLYDAIKSHTPGFMVDAKPAAIGAKLSGWAKDIDVGLRNDGMTLDGCKAAIDAAHRSDDDFWHSNLLSGKKLRQHYEKLRIRSNGKTKATSLDEIDFVGLSRKIDQWTTHK